MKDMNVFSDLVFLHVPTYVCPFVFFSDAKVCKMYKAIKRFGFPFIHASCVLLPSRKRI